MDDIEATAAPFLTRTGSIQVSKGAPLVFCSVPYGAAPSGCFSLNSPPPAPNLCFWLCSLAILTASTVFTLSLRAVPPTNLPLSLLWESLVIAIGLNLTVAHLCERGILCVTSTDMRVFAAITKWLMNKRRCWLATERKGVGWWLGNQKKERGFPHSSASVFTTHLFSSKVPRVVMDLIWAVGLSGPCHRGEERFKSELGRREGTTLCCPF